MANGILDQGILGALLRGYTSGQDEEERRRALEEQARLLGLQMPPPQDRSYWERVVRPHAGQQALDIQQSLLDAYQEQLYEQAQQREKQRLLQEREQALETQRQGGRKEIQGMRGTQAMERTQYERTTPQARLPEELEALRARTAAGYAGAESSRASTALKQQQTNLLERIQQAYGGTLGMEGGGAPGAAAPGGGGTAPIPGAPGFEYGPPGISIGGISLQPRETIERKAATAAATTQARERAQAQMAAEPAKEIITTLRSLSDQIHTQSDPITARGKGVIRWGGALIGTDEVAKLYRNNAEAYASSLSRSLAGERGVLTDRDIGRIQKAVPGLGATEQAADFQFSLMERLSEAANSPGVNRGEIERLIQKLEGYTAPTGGGAAPAEGEEEGDWIDEFLRRKGFQ